MLGGRVGGAVETERLGAVLPRHLAVGSGEAEAWSAVGLCVQHPDGCGQMRHLHMPPYLGLYIEVFCSLEPGDSRA